MEILILVIEICIILPFQYHALIIILNLLRHRLGITNKTRIYLMGLLDINIFYLSSPFS
jgi:hypothetical protein